MIVAHRWRKAYRGRKVGRGVVVVGTISDRGVTVFQLQPSGDVHDPGKKVGVKLEDFGAVDLGGGSVRAFGPLFTLEERLATADESAVRRRTDIEPVTGGPVGRNLTSVNLVCQINLDSETSEGDRAKGTTAS